MFKDILLTLTRQLYPRGRAFKMPFDGALEKLHKALGESENRAFIDALSTLNVVLPDNTNFTADDATDWERRLGMIYNPSLSLSIRKLAIMRKLNFPGTTRARQNFRYLEQQLRSAGFDVYVFENRFPDGSGGFNTQSPADIGGVLSEFQHGDQQHGDAQHGGGFSNVIANYIDENIDSLFSPGSNLRSTFFISGTPLGTFATVDESRKEEFRQMILQIKPVQTVGFLFVNYT